MRKLLLLALAASLSACATTARVDICKGAEVRRTGYTTAIAVADAAIVAGHGTSAVLLGRQAAATALAVLDRNCPVIR